MKTFKMKSLATAAAAAALGLGMTTSAHALKMSVIHYDVNNTANFQNWLVLDGGAGDGDGLVNGSITLNLSALHPIPSWENGWAITSSVNTINDSATSTLFTSNSMNVYNGSNSKMRVFDIVMDDNNTGPRNYVASTASGTFTGRVGPQTGTNLYYYNDPANGLPMTTELANYADFMSFIGAGAGNLNLTGTSGSAGNKVAEYTGYIAPASLSSYSYNSAHWLAVPDTGPFANTMIFDFTLEPGGSLSTRSMLMQTTQEAPEPTTVSLLGAGLVGLVAARRRKAKQEQAEA